MCLLVWVFRALSIFINLFVAYFCIFQVISWIGCSIQSCPGMCISRGSDSGMGRYKRPERVQSFIEYVPIRERAVISDSRLVLLVLRLQDCLLLYTDNFMVFN